MLRRAEVQAIVDRFEDATTDRSRLVIVKTFLSELRGQTDHPDAAEWVRIMRNAVRKRLRKKT